MITGWETCDYERLSILENRPTEVCRDWGLLTRQVKVARSYNWEGIDKLRSPRIQMSTESSSLSYHYRITAIFVPSVRDSPSASVAVIRQM